RFADRGRQQPELVGSRYWRQSRCGADHLQCRGGTVFRADLSARLGQYGRRQSLALKTLPCNRPRAFRSARAERNRAFAHQETGASRGRKAPITISLARSGSTTFCCARFHTRLSSFLLRRTKRDSLALQTKGWTAESLATMICCLARSPLQETARLRGPWSDARRHRWSAICCNARLPAGSKTARRVLCVLDTKSTPPTNHAEQYEEACMRKQMDDPSVDAGP